MMDTHMTRGQLIRHHRRERFLTQAGAAEMIGVSTATLSLWERDRIERIHPYNIDHIAPVLGIDPALLRVK